jgi:uncharacterized protein GlcG (DUF336 family)
MQAAARSLNRQMAVAVTDRRGVLLGVGTNFPINYQAACLACPTTRINPDPSCGDCAVVNLAVQLARTAAFFSADQTPLTSRSVRYLSGEHFPPGIRDTAAAALFGIENTNRGCSFDAPTDSLAQVIPRARSLAAQLTGLPCDALQGTDGCTTGMATLPGGVPIFKNGRMSAGIGVAIRGITLGPDPVAAKDAPDVILRRDDNDPAFTLAEFAARAFAGDDTGLPTLARTGLPGVCQGSDPPKCCSATNAAPPCFLGILPARSLPFDPVIFVDGIEIPEVDLNPPVSSVGTGSGITNFIIDPMTLQPPDLATCPSSQQACPATSGCLIGPDASCLLPPPTPDPSIPSVARLTAAEAQAIIMAGVRQAEATRAAIRLPFEARTAMVLAVSDIDGNLIGLYRMPDATVFSVDVAVAKSRNVIYFSSTQVADIDTRDCRGPDPTSCSNQAFFAKGTAITNRTISFASQPFFPSGIDGSLPGPFRRLFIDDSRRPCSNGQQPADEFPGRKDGIVFFPGSVPLYRNGVLVGGLGVSGDGVEQDDLVSFAGSTAPSSNGQDFQSPAAIRADQVFVRGVRLPYLKFNRQPEQ